MCSQCNNNPCISTCTPCSKGCLHPTTTNCVTLSENIVLPDNSVFPQDITNIQTVLQYFQTQINQLVNNTPSINWTDLKVNIEIGTNGNTSFTPPYMTTPINNKLQGRLDAENRLHLKGVVELDYASTILGGGKDEFIIARDRQPLGEVCIFNTLPNPTSDKYFKVNILHYVTETPVGTVPVKIIPKVDTAIIKLQPNGEMVSIVTLYDFITMPTNQTPQPLFQYLIPNSFNSQMSSLKALIFFDDVIINY